jgi:hypothetical protein
MRTRIVVALLLVLWLMSSNVLSKTYPQTQPPALHLVHKIYVEEMGTSDEAARFRLLLEDKLSEKGFTVVDRPEKADAVLGGALSVADGGIYSGPADVSVTARLNSPDNVRLWGANIGGRIIILNPVKSLKFKEPVEYRAKELAKKLRDDWEKSARTAGIKVGK